LKRFKTKEEEPILMVFWIHIDQFLRALRWLKKYNTVYKDIEIKEVNIGWMGDKKKMGLDVAATMSHLCGTMMQILMVDHTGRTIAIAPLVFYQPA
jgi:hypothetical protein